MRLSSFALLVGLSGVSVSASLDVQAAPRIAGGPRLAAAPRIAGAPKKAPLPKKGRATKTPPAEAHPDNEPADTAGQDDATAPPASSADNGGAAAPEPDTKLDDKPPPQTAGSTGKTLSPLNPEPPESPKPAPAAGPEALDKLIADIATLRARVAALTTSLFSSKLRVFVHTDGDEARVLGFTVTLDDGVVFKGDTGFAAEDEKVVYEHAVAPGSHVVGIEIERQDTRGAAYRTWQTTRFAIQVPERQVLEAIVTVEDDSDMADDFPDDKDGKYELGVKLRAKVAK
ncbi:MAG TPA: hypothetical protein VH062_30640 [Polyangiaceae bacterium]|jgi:hypothetical protein|nr:hypothetical protein [Polyangiaceae bacterium]